MKGDMKDARLEGDIFCPYLDYRHGDADTRTIRRISQDPKISHIIFSDFHFL